MVRVYLKDKKGRRSLRHKDLSYMSVEPRRALQLFGRVPAASQHPVPVESACGARAVVQWCRERRKMGSIYESRYTELGVVPTRRVRKSVERKQSGVHEVRGRQQ
jgi:hypothetical protein